MIKFHNASERQFVSIEGETRRTYNFGEGVTVTIDGPRELHRSDSGHYVFDSNGVMHFIPHGWIELTWEVVDSGPHIWL